MKNYRVKLFAAALFVLSAMAFGFFGTKPIGTIVKADTAEETYKAKCAMCHSPKAEKSFDPAKTDEELVEIILKGKKGEKPPFMPGFEAKGMTADEAKALVVYMKKLRNPDKPANTPSNTNSTAKEVTKEMSRDAIIEMYQSKCTACHGANAEKLYDSKISFDEQTRIILKGKKGEKPPFMPEFETKGITEKQAKALAAYMIELRTPDK